MRFFNQLLGTGVGLAPSLQLFFDERRYLVDCGEGMQRFCTEHKVRLAKMNHIFLTGISSDEVSGLPGMLLTLADMGNKQVHLFGPKNLAQVVHSFRFFVVR